MCGIAGFTHRVGCADSRQRIEAAITGIIARGPDQQGYFESPLVSLGAARLKIIDLTSGNQPIISDDGDHVIVYNGEIYNHLEVRGELEQRGHRFRSHTDTEVLLHAFMEWDTDCFARFRGMFAAALWCESRRRLVLCRDRLGIKPLYFTQRGNDLFFGSEIKTILVHPEIERRLDLACLDSYLSLNYTPCPWTLIQGIKKLKPGHWLEWNDGAIRDAAYWQLPLRSAGSWTLGSAKEQLDSLLTQSAKEHLISDVPLGIWLSGGIDSSTVLHYAANVSPARLNTFSITFAGRSFDDGAFSRIVANHYATNHQQFDLERDIPVLDAIEKFSYFADDPNADAGALPVWFLSELTKKTATVALSGEGADELFAGYLTYRADHLSDSMRLIPQALLKPAARLARLYPVSDEKIGFDYMLKRFLRGCTLPPEEAHVYWNGTFSAAEKNFLLNSHAPASFPVVLEDLRRAGNDFKARLWFDQKYYLPDDILAKVDRISMAHSLEIRPPFLDHRIVEFAATLPENLQMNGSRQKVLLKELMRGKLPGEILTRKKVGFDIPVHQWLRGSLKEFATDVILSGARQYANVFRPDAVEHYLRRHLDRNENIGYHLWGLLILFLWMRRWKISTA